MKLSFTLLAVLLFNLLFPQLSKAFSPPKIIANETDTGGFKETLTTHSKKLTEEGITAFRNGDYAIAEEKLSEAILLDGNSNYNAYAVRGSLYMMQEKYQVAIKDYNRVIDLNIKDPAIFSNRGRCHFQIGNYDQAQADALSALALNPNHADAYMVLGLVSISKRNKQQALIELQNASYLYQQQGNTAGYQAMMEIISALQSSNM